MIETDNKEKTLLTIPPRDLPQMPDPGHDGLKATLASPRGIRRTMLFIAFATILAITAVAVPGIIEGEMKRKEEVKKAQDVRSNAASEIEAQNKLWESATVEEVLVSDKSFSDNFGYGVSVNKVVKNFKSGTPQSHWELTDKGRKQIILIEYTISKVPSKTLGPGPSSTELKIKANDAVVGKSYDSTLAKAAEAAGYALLTPQKVADGASVTGFVPYVVDKDSAISIVYRSGESIVGIGSPAVPAKDYLLEIL